LRSSKKFKADQDQTNPENATGNNGLSSPSAAYGNQTVKRDDVMQDRGNEKDHLSLLTPEAKNDLNLKETISTETADVIDLDADDDDMIKCSTKPFGNSDHSLDAHNQSGCYEHDNNEPTAFGCEHSFLKHSVETVKSTFQENLTKTKPQNVQELPVFRSMNATTSWKKETLTIGGISKQATRLASGTGPQPIHNFNSLSGEFLYGCSK
jgi:TRAF-interacting protein